MKFLQTTKQTHVSQIKQLQQTTSFYNTLQLLKTTAYSTEANGKLDAAGDITRENMALVLVRAYDAVNETDLVAYVEEQDFKKDVTDRATAKAEARPSIDVLDYFDITNPAAPKFNPKGTTTRGQFASFLHKTSQVEAPNAELAVEGISAASASTLTVTGTGLKNLKAEDITVTGNTVTSVTAAANGKTATVVLGTLLTPNVEYTVTVKGKIKTLKSLIH